MLKYKGSLNLLFLFWEGSHVGCATTDQNLQARVFFGYTKSSSSVHAVFSLVYIHVHPSPMCYDMCSSMYSPLFSSLVMCVWSDVFFIVLLSRKGNTCPTPTPTPTPNVLMCKVPQPAPLQKGACAYSPANLII